MFFSYFFRLPKTLRMKDINFISKSCNDTYIYHNEVVRIMADFNHSLNLISLSDSDIQPHEQQNDKDNLQQQATNILNKQFKNCNQPCFTEYRSLSIYSDNNNNSNSIDIIQHFNESQLQTLPVNTLLLSKYNRLKACLHIDLYYTLDGRVIEKLHTFIDGIIDVNNDNNTTTTYIENIESIFKSKTKSNGVKNNFITSGRYHCYLELSEILRNHMYSGLFEIHITVKNDVDDAGNDIVEHFKDVCKTIGCKPVLIELPKGEHPTQLMTSFYHRAESLAHIQRLAYRQAQQLIDQRFTITRIKVEIMFSGEGVPLGDDQQSLDKVSSENYFEFHIKLTLPSDYHDYSELNTIVARHNAHLSKNAFKSSGGEQQRFVTMRLYHTGKQSAEHRYLACVDDLEQHQYTITAKMREYSIYDSNVHLDKGWIEYSTTK
ncbi:hypothetical protein PPL_02324 [Heterostelium album PN500]|uniref:Uncharacterized protein n=1 Tax=Heterostelium pallidum (strain ATCC 26659 / Pp 5 / PN500) TaxID=670386 RepID=D3B1Z9_HETP5|nr:hypothetical protein PPL_02324 [Heterostelium album PN500]EFA85323.1 hypothetical protein PPL_02324 [Heterostelium album PN500]|eukprot:XP_020437432.1 hypothetical protein PPL_02324 [Heterostelium album PN500]